MKTKHTPGKWKTSCKAIQCESLNKYGNWIIATCEREGNEEEDDANLRLMAAAPELLAALQEVELRTTQARIASGIGKNTKQHTISFLLSELARIAEFARAAIQKAQGEV